MTGTPRCFQSSEQLMEWRRLNVPTKESARICDDCTPEYHGKMVKAGKCDADVWMYVNFGPGMTINFRDNEK